MRTLCVLAVLLAVASAQDANPSVPYYGYGSIVATPNPPILGSPTAIDVTVSNSGSEDAMSVEVQLSFNTWGVVFDGWQSIGTQVVDIPAGQDVTLSFFHTFISRTHTCLEVKLVGWGAGGNSNLGDDRGQINLEVIHNGDNDLTYEVPIVNNGENSIDARIRVGCMVDGRISDRCPDGTAVAVKNPPTSELSLAPGEEVRAEVVAVGLSADSTVDIVLEAYSPTTGETNHVLLQVVPTSFADLLNSITLCCLKDVRSRVYLGTILLRALQAYEDNAWTEALRLLRVFVQQTSVFDCKSDEEGRACLERAIALVTDAARMLAASSSAAAGDMAAELEPTGLPEGFNGTVHTDTTSALRRGDTLREAGEDGAAMLQYQAMHWSSCGVCAAHVGMPRHEERFAGLCSSCRFLFTSVQYPYQLFTSVQGPYRLFTITSTQYPFERRTSVQWPYQLSAGASLTSVQWPYQLAGGRRPRQRLSGTAVTSVQYPYKLDYFTSVQYPYQLSASGSLVSSQWPYRLERATSAQGPYQTHPTQLFAHNVQQLDS